MRTSLRRLALAFVVLGFASCAGGTEADSLGAPATPAGSEASGTDVDASGAPPSPTAGPGSLPGPPTPGAPPPGGSTTSSPTDPVSVAGPGPAPPSAGPSSGGPSSPAPEDGTCPAGAQPCGDRCSNPSIDPQNCGACGVACAEGTVCDSGQCVCAGVNTACADGCVDLQSDPAHCGACDTACSDGQVCNQGSCSAERSCASHLTLCGSACIDTQGSAQNCGACGNECPPNQACQAGNCRCPVGQDLCGGACIPVTEDEANCGACSNVCAAEQTCTAGTCECPAGEILCGGDCIDPTTDAQHCGECGTACSGSTQCLSGACVDPTSVRCEGTGGGTSDLCGSGQAADVGKYVVVNNQWGEDTGSGSQCTQATCLQGDLVGWRTEFEWSGEGNSVKAYPNMILGWNWSDPRTSITGLPVQLSANRSVQCGWDFSVNASGTLNVAYDLWLHTTGSPNGSEPTDEVMIWLYTAGGAGPISDGNPDSATVAGATWQLHRGQAGTFNVWSFVRSGNVTTAVLDLNLFLQDLVQRGYLQSNKYLSGVHGGSEIFTGSGSIVHNGYYCRVQ